jgi:spermidine/putrescine transport system ATP-binding protein
VAPILEVERVVKRFHSTIALAGLSVSVEQGEFMALVGPSGCGKTTLLKIIGGFEVPDEGRVLVEGKDVTGVPPALRPTSMVFQRLALFPHKTVAENIGFSLKLQHMPAAQMRARIEDMARLMELDLRYLERFPRQLSGGEQQRVALARSMISSPSILLLDEPLTALDFKLKKALQAELKRLHRQLGVTFVHVTHDLEEAMILADRICVIRSGDVLQTGEPADIYYRPRNAFIAQFIGDTNLFDIQVTGVEADGIRYDNPAIVDADKRVAGGLVAADVETGRAVMMVRPERMQLFADRADVDCRVAATIEEVFVKGGTIQYRAACAASRAPLVFEVPGTRTLPVELGASITAGWKREDVFVFAADRDD